MNKQRVGNAVLLGVVLYGLGFMFVKVQHIRRIWSLYGIEPSAGSALLVEIARYGSLVAGVALVVKEWLVPLRVKLRVNGIAAILLPIVIQIFVLMMALAIQGDVPR